MSEKPIERDRRHRVWLEYISILDEFNRLRKEGYTIRAIYDFFVNNKKITMTYTTLLRYNNGLVPKTKQVPAGQSVKKEDCPINKEKNLDFIKNEEENDQKSKIKLPGPPVLSKDDGSASLSEERRKLLEDFKHGENN